MREVWYIVDDKSDDTSWEPLHDLVFASEQDALLALSWLRTKDIADDNHVITTATFYETFAAFVADYS